MYMYNFQDEQLKMHFIHWNFIELQNQNLYYSRRRGRVERAPAGVLVGSGGRSGAPCGWNPRHRSVDSKTKQTSPNFHSNISNGVWGILLFRNVWCIWMKRLRAKCRTFYFTLNKIIIRDIENMLDFVFINDAVSFKKNCNIFNFIKYQYKVINITAQLYSFAVIRWMWQ